MHHLLIYSADHDPRVPPFLNGALTAVPVKRFIDVGAQTNAPWFNAAERRYRFQGPLWFVSREQRIDLDFYPAADGFLASDRMLQVLETSVPQSIRALPVAMVDEDGRDNTARPMLFCQIMHRRIACDLDRIASNMAHHAVLDAGNSVETRDGRRVIVRAASVPLAMGLPDLLEAEDLPPPAMLASDDLISAAMQADLLGVRFISIADIAVVDFWPMEPGRYSLCHPHWVQHQKLDTWRRLNGPPQRAAFNDPRKPSDPAVAALVQSAIERINRTPQSSDWRLSAEQRYPDLEPHAFEAPMTFWMALRYSFEDAVEANDLTLTARILSDVRDWLSTGAAAKTADQDPYTAVVIGFLEGLLGVRGADAHLLAAFDHDELLDMKVFLSHGLFNGRRYASLMRQSAAR
jgi:hypothetical protein